ncbi:MAG: hypothetical protein Q9164_006746 [Protoblastenia rupestris]
MATFLDLSTEILSLIALEVCPTDKVNFALISRCFLHASNIALRQHIELQRSYSIVNNRNPSTLPTLVLKTLRNPHVGYYVRELLLETALEGDQFVHLEDDLRLLEHTLKQSCFLPEIEDYYALYDDEGEKVDDESALDTQDICNSLKKGDQSFIVALLLLHLPNLAVLSWQMDCSCAQDVDIFIPIIRRLFLQDNSPVFLNLQKVILRPLGDEDNLDYDLIKTFMAFPSVHSITIRKVTFMEKDRQYKQFPWPETSNLSELILDEPEFDWLSDSQESFKNMLASSQNLKAFRYKHSPHTQYLYPENDICGMVLEEKPLLEELTVSFSEGAGIPDSIFHLRNLTNLRFFETEFLTLHSRNRYRPGDKAAEPAKRLPPSLQHLRFYEQPQGDQKAYLEFAAKLLHNKEELLPKLQKMELFMMEQGNTNASGYLMRLASFIGNEKGVDVCIDVSEQPRTIFRD